MNRLLSLPTVLRVSLLWLAMAQLPLSAQLIPVGPPPGAPPPVLVQGSTLAALRHEVQTAADQCRFTAQTATDMGRRAYAAAYQMENLTGDFQNLQLQFQNLRSSFNLAAHIALQMQSSRAANAAAELEAGLNIISEAFAPVQQEMQSGTVNRDTVASMCRVLNEALRLWERELKKKSSRLGMIR